MDPAEMAKTVAEARVPGRVTPQQKEELVRLLQGAGHSVAMIGDGVKGVLPLKQVQVGIAMQGGSQATRSVADAVLLKDSFAALPIAFRKGQRIMRSMEDVLCLLMTRTLYVLLLILATRLAGLVVPVTPKHKFGGALGAVPAPGLALTTVRAPSRRFVATVRPSFRMPSTYTPEGNP